ncbi:hypothetical protein [Anaeromyxobacter soli]|uniref:hypothetical protein n=1 Tax=Anaeromyxobacter soli TaxID=2922725 RepID=UPI001FAF6E48|nr:hypothetical protein [Anaeromyxobacter sp. SG29]
MARRRAGEGGLPGGEEVGRLLATSPSRFTAERDALARALAERGDAAGAAALRKVRRPVGLAWVLNRVARERGHEIEALLEAGDRLRAGQRRALAGQGAAALREAEQELRTAARALRGRAAEVLASEGRPASPVALARVELLLRVAATAPGGAREALRAGALQRDPEVAAGDLSGLGLVAGGGAEAAGTASGGTAGTSRKARAAAPRASAPKATAAGSASGAEAQRAERAERARAERQARLRARALGAARERLEQAEGRAREARRAAEVALRRADEARARAEAAEAGAAARRAELEALERE